MEKIETSLPDQYDGYINIASTQTVIDIRKKLLFSFNDFKMFFFRVLTGSRYLRSMMSDNYCYNDDLSQHLENVYYGKIRFLDINMPPGFGKSTDVTLFIAWCFARNPSCLFIYAACTATLAQSKCDHVRTLLKTQEYQTLFPWVKISRTNDTKKYFTTERQKHFGAGALHAVGVGGNITGLDAGRMESGKFTGCLIIDDPIQISDGCSSSVKREAMHKWYAGDAFSRLRNKLETPIICIYHRTHLDDLRGYKERNNLLKDQVFLTIPLLKNNELVNNIVYNDNEVERIKQQGDYFYQCLYMQDPISDDAALFKINRLNKIECHPKYLATFITADTAETVEDYSDYSVFSFWGLHKIIIGDTVTDDYGLVWLDCYREKLEPEDLYNAFLKFLGKCMLFETRPTAAYIEKKSSGTTLLSRTQALSNISIQPIERDRESKMERFIRAAISGFNLGKVSILKSAMHLKTCEDELRTITISQKQLHDDIVDTLSDAIELGIIKKNVPIIPDNSANFNIYEEFRSLQRPKRRL